MVPANAVVLGGDIIHLSGVGLFQSTILGLLVLARCYQLLERFYAADPRSPVCGVQR